MTSEGEWQRAAVPALILVLVSLVPVGLALRGTAAGVGGRPLKPPQFSIMRRK